MTSINQAWTLWIASTPFMNIHIPVVKTPQFRCLGRHCFGKDPWGFSLLAASTKSFFLPTFVLAVSLVSTPTKRWTWFRVTVLAQTGNLCQSESSLEDPQLISDKSDGGPELCCNPQSGTPALTHLARVAVKRPASSPQASDTFQSHPCPGQQVPLSHPDCSQPLSTTEVLLPYAAPSLLHPQARVAILLSTEPPVAKAPFSIPLPSLTRYKLRFIPTQNEIFLLTVSFEPSKFTVASGLACAYQTSLLKISSNNPDIRRSH